MFTERRLEKLRRTQTTHKNNERETGRRVNYFLTIRRNIFSRIPMIIPPIISPNIFLCMFLLASPIAAKRMASSA